MSFTINTQASNAVLAIAQAYDTLQAIKHHKIDAANAKARHALAGYARDAKAHFDALMHAHNGFNDVALMSKVTAVYAAMRSERAEDAKLRRLHRERMEAERAALLGELALIAA